jgi:hypothetical protein
MAKSILAQGKQVPQELLNQLQKDKINEVRTDIYNQSIVQTQQQNRPPQVPNKFSPEYAKYIGHKPKATASARIHLGGVY